MSDWVSIPPSSWELSTSLQSVENVGIGPFAASYSINKDYPISLNGLIEATFKVPDWQDTGSVGVLCRADLVWSGVLFYVYAPKENVGTVSPVLARYQLGQIRYLTFGVQDFPIVDDQVQLQFSYSSNFLRGTAKSGNRETSVEAYSSDNAFPGYVGVIRFYGAKVEVLDFKWESMKGEREQMSSHQWDAFMCHSGDDKVKVRQIADELRQEGLRVWLDEEQIEIGDRVTEKIEQGLSGSRRVIVCLSPSLGLSNWVRSEYGPYINDEISRGGQARVIPLVIETVDVNHVPVLLRDKLRVVYGSSTDWTRLIQKLRS